MSDSPLKKHVRALNDSSLPKAMEGIDKSISNMGNIFAESPFLKAIEDINMFAERFKLANEAALQLRTPLCKAMEDAGPLVKIPKALANDFFAVQRKPLGHGFPRVDVYELNNKFVIEFSIAGVDPNNVAIQINEDPNSSYRDFGSRSLHVSGKMDDPYEHKKDAQYHIKELSRKHFTRTLILPDYVKTDPIASYKNGMLTLSFELPAKQEPPKPQIKTIAITQQGDE